MTEKDKQAIGDARKFLAEQYKLRLSNRRIYSPSFNRASELAADIYNRLADIDVNGSS